MGTSSGQGWFAANTPDAPAGQVDSCAERAGRPGAAEPRCLASSARLSSQAARGAAGTTGRPPVRPSPGPFMGRIFETRKATMFARWDKMSKMFARIGKEITIAVKKGGPNPDSNPSLRRVIQNARAANMPKDKVESAIKKASGHDQAGYEEVLYEGYGPHGIAIVVETATDNIVRTVANIRHHFLKGGGTMGNSNSVLFQFKRMGVFRLGPAGLDPDALELDLIDHGLEEMGETTSEKG